MANCPQCGFALKPWHIKAECPSCGVNIPNYRWEERLEEDAARSEEAFGKLRTYIAHFKSALVGSRLRVVRLVCVFLPLILVVLPYASVSLTLPFYAAERQVSLLNIILLLVSNFDIQAIFAFATGTHVGTALLPGLLCVVLLVLSILAAVINFLLTLLCAPKLGYKGNVACCIISLLLTIGSGICYAVFAGALTQTPLAAFTTTGAWGLCLAAGIVIYLGNTVLNLAVGRGLRAEHLRNEAETASPLA